MTTATLEQIREATITGDAETVTASTQALLAQGVPPDQILDQALIPAMTEVGQRFAAGEFFVPEMLIAARAMKMALAILAPALKNTGFEPAGKVVLGTVQGDLHDIGKNLVGALLEGAGFQVIDIGIDVPPAKFVEAVATHHPYFVGMSALLTTTMPMMKTTIEALKTAGLRKDVKVMIGGAPVTQDYADKIGADLYAPDAATAAQKARAAMGLPLK